MDHLEYGAQGIQVEYVRSDHVRPPRTKSEFHAFPETMGWRVADDYKLEIAPNASSSSTFDSFLQAWLFFGLVSAVVQEDEQPVLEFDKLHSDRWLHTKCLNDALQIWVNWERRNSDGLWFRMVQVDYVLERARQVVRRNCGYDFKTREVVYSTDPDDVSRHLTDEKAMALMTLGECLCAVKAKIMEDNGSANLAGWHGDDDDGGGWGPPKWVFTEMEKDNWCPRNVSLLKGQFRSNATLLLQAYHVYKGSRMTVERHERCDGSNCKVKSEDSRGQYTNPCRTGCKLSAALDGCQMVGPNPEDVIKILQSAEELKEQGLSGIPVLRFRDSHSVELEVLPLPLKMREPFATISHVWSDGWGNEKSNTLRTCQLQFIRRQLQRLHPGKDILFWMDTLVIPVQEVKPDDGMKKLKKVAIGQISTVFQRSDYTIVLDNGLCASDSREEDMPTQTAMKILTSRWMTRLWTLQEAFLSQKLYISFKERRHDHNNLTSFNELDQKLSLSSDDVTFPLIRTVRNLLFDSIMGQERQTKKDYVFHKTKRPDMPKHQAALLIASAWYAARWRTTTNSCHETLALSTLLDLDYAGTKIAEAGLRRDATIEENDDLVCLFWEALHKSYAGAIPAGIIFLPGERITGKVGLSWAPRTWLSASEVDYPNPLGHWNRETELQSNGLVVRYPGFILHTYSQKARRKIVGTDALGTTFRFPVDRRLLEWYNAKPADATEINNPALPFFTGIVHDHTRLAIILSRPQPGDSPCEIGLLVEIYDDFTSKTTAEKTYSCQIIRRLHVWRETRASYVAGPGRNMPVDPTSFRDGDTSDDEVPHWNIIGNSLEKENFGYCIGEAVPSDQAWMVDGYNEKRRMEKRRMCAGMTTVIASESLASQKTWLNRASDMFHFRPFFT